MESTTTRTPREVFAHHVEALGAEDVHGIVSVVKAAAAPCMTRPQIETHPSRSVVRTIDREARREASTPNWLCCQGGGRVVSEVTAPGERGLRSP